MAGGKIRRGWVAGLFGVGVVVLAWALGCLAWSCVVCHDVKLGAKTWRWPRLFSADLSAPGMA